jgi:hypothetical protein
MGLNQCAKEISTGRKAIPISGPGIHPDFVSDKLWWRGNPFSTPSDFLERDSTIQNHR